MSIWHLRDGGVPIEQACSIAGVINPAAYMIMRGNGDFGHIKGGSRERAPLPEVAAARALLEAERSGAIRTKLKPFIKKIAEAAWVWLATKQLSQRCWDGDVPRSLVEELAKRVTTDEGQIELQQRLKVDGRYDLSRPFALLQNEDLVFSNSPPETVSYGQQPHFVDIRAVAQHIENYAGKQLLIAAW